MTQGPTRSVYLKAIEEAIHTKRGNTTALNEYFTKQADRLEHLIRELSEETFWQVFPEILGIDARLTLLLELIPYTDISPDEILRIVEQDYKTYFKELCGYDLQMKDKPSMVFHIT